jgi:hypothetical protein
MSRTVMKESRLKIEQLLQLFNYSTKNGIYIVTVNTVIKLIFYLDY